MRARFPSPSVVHVRCLLAGPTGGDGSDAIGGGWSEPKDSKDILLARETSRVLSSRSLLDSLHIVERALQQNVFHAAHRYLLLASVYLWSVSLIFLLAFAPQNVQGCLRCGDAGVVGVWYHRDPEVWRFVVLECALFAALLDFPPWQMEKATGRLQAQAVAG